MIRDNEDMINVFDVERIFGDLPLDIIKENVKSLYCSGAFLV